MIAFFFYGMKHPALHKHRHTQPTSPVIAMILVVAGWICLAPFYSRTIYVLGMRLDVGIPGIGKISYRDGLLRIKIRPPLYNDDNGDDDSNSSSFGVVPRNAFGSEWKNELPIVHKETPNKGYGAFYAGTEPLPEGTFLGLYKGRLINSREELDELHATRRRGNNPNDNVSDYVMSLDGGVHFLDGYEFRYNGGDNDNTDNTDCAYFTPAHLNHSDKDTPECNVFRRLVYVPDDDDVTLEVPMDDFETYPKNLPRVAFFAGREIATGEELCFDYGTNFWGKKKKNVQ